ncbi:FAS1-like dehydratase domain-containing protein [Neobacillus niacini]
MGDNNPLYHDEEYAKAHGFESIVAPPTFVSSFR